MPTNSTSATSDNTVDRYKLLFRLQILAAIGTVFIIIYSLSFIGSGEILRIIGAGVLISAAALTSGFLSGFVFGIPRVGSEKAVATATSAPSGANVAASEAQANAVTPNSNLVEISDWLTKILVGVGLVELNTIPNKLGKLSYYIGPALRPSACGPRSFCADYATAGQATALAIILFYFTLGFLLGYVWTRLYFQKDLGGLVENLQKETMIAGQIMLAEASLHLGQLDEAMKSVDVALSIDPSDGRVVLTQARILKRQAEQRANSEEKRALLNRALASANQAISLLPGKAEPFYNAACYQTLLGFDRAPILENLSAAFRLDPSLRQVAAQDEDFTTLRQDPNFTTLVGEGTGADQN